MVVIHNQTESPNLHKAVFVASGTYTNIQVNKIVYNRLPSPYSSCRHNLSITEDDSEYFKIASNYSVYNLYNSREESWSKKYNIENCHDVYYQLNYFEKYCECHNPDLYYAEKEQICHTVEELSCLLDAIRELVNVTISIS